ncbi:MAG: sporulation integral membrane protein YtvI [Breznakia sp.]
MNIENRKHFLINLIYTLIVISITYILIRYGLAWCLPFVLGFTIAMLLQKPIHFFSDKLNVNNKIVAIIVLLFFYLVIGSIAAFVVVKILSTIGEVIYGFPDFYKSTISPALIVVTDGFSKLLANISHGEVLQVDDINEQLKSMALNAVPAISTTSFQLATGFFSAIPAVLIGFLFTIISSFFFVIDYRKIVDFVLLQCNAKQREIILGIKTHGLGTITKFIKSYGMIMFITFSELSIGFTIMGIENAVGIALVIAIFDILPVLGTGGVMIPWVLISLINGDTSLALQLLVIYGVITVVRNVVEPKIVGEQVGTHPIMMLLCMYIGVRLFGALGIFLLPIIVIIVKNLNDEGVIHIFKMPSIKK